MISELKDEEMLDFLMNSEFIEDYKPEEYRYLLLKWRYYYRIIWSDRENLKTNTQGEIKTLNGKIDTLMGNLSLLEKEIKKKEKQIASIKNKKLSFKERILGKIITKNEN
jgi:SMC interacting uncharacterized protein involved in chromosome segregation